MSRQSYIEFQEKLTADPGLFQEFVALGGENASAVSPEEIVKFGEARGFSFTVDDVKGEVELSDEQLAKVSGGFDSLASMGVGRVAAPASQTLLVKAGSTFNG